MSFEQVRRKVIVTNFQKVKLSLLHRKNSTFSNLGVTFMPKFQGGWVLHGGVLLWQIGTLKI